MHHLPLTTAVSLFRRGNKPVSGGEVGGNRGRPPPGGRPEQNPPECPPTAGRAGRRAARAGGARRNTLFEKGGGILRRSSDGSLRFRYYAAPKQQRYRGRAGGRTVQCDCCYSHSGRGRSGGVLHPGLRLVILRPHSWGWRRDILRLYDDRCWLFSTAFWANSSVGGTSRCHSFWAVLWSP